jgi:hypothetical protein
MEPKLTRAQWYPLVYNIKLSVELGLSTLIVRIANEKTVTRHRVGKPSPSETNITQGSIYVSHDQDVQNTKTEPLDDLPPCKSSISSGSLLKSKPAFGQYITRPANWQETYILKDEESKVDFNEKDAETYELGPTPTVQVSHAV